VGALDDDLGNRSLLEVLEQRLTDLQIFLQQRTILAPVRVPTRIPGAIDAEAQADWIDLLAHYAVSST
jgi:hypothetical protein